MPNAREAREFVERRGTRLAAIAREIESQGLQEKNDYAANALEALKEAQQE